MAYRAPELFDVKTGQTLDEKVDIWVRPVPLSAADEHNQSNFYTFAVTRLHTFRSCVLAFPIRRYPDDGTGWFNSYGCVERAV